MFYYIHLRKAGKLNWKAFREDGKILVFNKYEVAKKYADQLNGFVCKIMSINYYPAHRKSHLHGKKYKKIGW